MLKSLLCKNKYHLVIGSEYNIVGKCLNE